jgi:hypothetical protein
MGSEHVVVLTSDDRDIASVVPTGKARIVHI